MGSGPITNANPGESLADAAKRRAAQQQAPTPGAATPTYGSSGQMTTDMGMNDPSTKLSQAGWAQRNSGGLTQWRDPASGIWSDQNAALAHVQDLKNQNLNPDGSPKRPDFQSIIDPKTGQLMNQFQMNVNPLDPNSLAGLQAMKGEALRSGPSQWANIQLAKLNADRATGMNQAVSGAGQALAAGRSSLATRGGLSSGARERLGANSIRDMLLAKQGVSGQANQNRYGILGQDETNRLGMLGQYAGAEGNLAQFNQGNNLKQSEFNLTNLLQENQAKRADTQAKYDAELKKWGAAGTAAGIS